MHRFAAVSLLVAGAQATTSPPTASPFPECPVNIQITTEAPTAAPSQSPTSWPTYHPTASPVVSTAEPTAAAISTTATPQGTIQNPFIPAWGDKTFPGLCRCDILDEETQPFLDRNDTYCGNKAGMLAAWEGAVHFTCPHCGVVPGTSINITCPNNWETCELLLNLYVCPGCSSNGAQMTTGMWPSSLSTDGWVAAGRCTGDWCEEDSSGAATPAGKQHPFVGFHKQILGGDTEMIPETVGTAMYFSLLVKEGKVCDQINDMTQCQQAPLCHWSSTDNNCYQDWCPTVNSGNTPANCAPCAPGTPDGTCQG